MRAVRYELQMRRSWRIWSLRHSVATRVGVANVQSRRRWHHDDSAVVVLSLLLTDPKQDADRPLIRSAWWPRPPVPAAGFSLEASPPPNAPIPQESLRWRRFALPARLRGGIGDAAATQRRSLHSPGRRPPRFKRGLSRLTHHTSSVSPESKNLSTSSAQQMRSKRAASSLL